MTKDWQHFAQCIGAPINVFFPQSRRHTDNTWREARAMCDRCTVKKECLDLALSVPQTDDRWGMFGGTTPTERRKMRRVELEQ